MDCSPTLAVTLAATLASVPGAQVAWTSRSPATAPSPRCCTDMAYDPARDRAVIFGGFVAGAGFGAETWEWDGSTWARPAPPVAPARRDSHALVHDGGRGGVLLFGGSTESTVYGDTWEWDGSSWTLRASTGPSPRQAMELAYDAARDTILLFGGVAQTSPCFGDTWEWNGSAWTQRTPATSPAARSLYGMVHDPIRRRTLLFGGGDPFAATFFADTWEWDGTTWTQRQPATVPVARMRHTMVWDAARERIVLFGGQSAGGVLGDTWEWDGTTWIARSVATPPAMRRTHAMAYDSNRRCVVMYGGVLPGTSFYGDTWEYGPVNPSSYRGYGAGCAGTVGPPVLLATPGALPWIGATLSVDVTVLPPGPAFMMVGTSRTQWGTVTLPAALSSIGMSGCTLLASPELSAGLVPTGGTARWSVPLCACPSWVGLSIYMQAGGLDPGGNPAGVILSNAVQATLGAK